MEDCVKPICNGGNGPKTTNQFSFHFANINILRETPLNKIRNIHNAILEENKNRTVYIVISKTKVFFYLGFLSQTFMNHRTAGEGGGYLFNSPLPFPLASQTLGHWLGDYCRELTSAHS